MRLRGTFRCVLAGSVAVLLFATSAAHAQLSTGASVPPATLEDALHQMADKAGIIFAGQVIAVHRHESGDGASGYVEVEFSVDQAVRGCTAGSPYVLREWAGLWAGGVSRYRIGERLLMFLHPPGASGLSSPISGMDGAVPIHGAIAPLVAGETAQYPVTDLRWVATHVLRPVSYRTESPHFNHRSGVVVPFLDTPTRVQAKPETAERADIPLTPTLAARDQTATPAAESQAPVQTIIKMLRAWQKANDATH